MQETKTTTATPSTAPPTHSPTLGLITAGRPSTCAFPAATSTAYSSRQMQRRRSRLYDGGPHLSYRLPSHRDAQYRARRLSNAVRCRTLETMMEVLTQPVAFGAH